LASDNDNDWDWDHNTYIRNIKMQTPFWVHKSYDISIVITSQSPAKDHIIPYILKQMQTSPSNSWIRTSHSISRKVSHMRKLSKKGQQASKTTSTKHTYPAYMLPKATHPHIESSTYFQPENTIYYV
jgi:hypothetical protein